MKREIQELRSELAAVKRELRRRQRYEAALRRNLVDLSHALDSLLDQPSVAPKLRNYDETISISQLIADLERKQILLAWKKHRKSILSNPADKFANELFTRADSEYGAKYGELPGRDQLILYARGQLEKLNLPPLKKDLLSDHRAKKYLNQRNALIDGGFLTADDFIDPYLNGDVVPPESYD